MTLKETLKGHNDDSQVTRRHLEAYETRPKRKR